MGVLDVTVRYCTVDGEEVTTTLEQARAKTIVAGLPVRVPPTYRGQRSYPGLFWASTNDRTLVYESLLELDQLWLADFDTSVAGICTQPFQLSGRDGSGPRSHVPDVLLVHSDHSVTVVDVKPATLLDEPQVRDQFEWTRSLCGAKGWGYEVFSGGDATVLRNLKLLAVGRRRDRLPEGLLDRVRARLDEGCSTLGQVWDGRPTDCPESIWRVAIFALIWSGELTIDLGHPLGQESVVRAMVEVRT